MASEVEIVNLALDELGKVAIRDFSTTATDPYSGRLAKRRYEISRDLLLSKHDWSFARSTVALQLVSNATHPEGVVYQLPSDCHVPRRIAPRIGAPTTWSVEGNYVIIPFNYTCSYGVQPILRYTKRVTQTSLFKPYFVNALAILIAAKMAMPLNCDKAVADKLYKLFNIEWREAALIDSNIGEGDDYMSQDLQYDTFVRTDVPVMVYSNGQ